MKFRIYSFFISVGYLITLSTFVMLDAFSIENTEVDEIKLNDPDTNIENLTYSGFNFISTIKTSEMNFPGEYFCQGECSSYKKVIQCTNIDTTYNFTDKCEGMIRDCILYKEKSTKKPLVELIGPLNYISNRNDYIENYIPILQSTCAVCSCYCDTSYQYSSIKRICIDDVLSNVAEGFVITGVRMRIIDKILIIQIQEGKMVDGAIDQTTVRWVEKNTCDVRTLLDYDDRELQFDDIIVYKGWYVTGISFHRNINTRRIQITLTGREAEESKSININSTEAIFSELENDRSDIMTSDMNNPTMCIHNKELSTSGMYFATFQLPNLSKDDSTNLLMPYIDIRELASKKPLQGVGLYWRGNQDCGGYVAPKIFVSKN